MAIIDKIQLSGTVYTIGNETTTAVTSASTDNEIPTAKAVYDAIPQGGGGKAIEAGTNISITTGDTADTINCTLPISATTQYQDSHNLIFLLGRNTSNDNTINHNSSYGNIIAGYNNTLGNRFDQAMYNFVFGNNNGLEGNYQGKHADKNFVVGDYNFFGSLSSGYAVTHTAVFGDYNQPKNNYEYAFGKYNNSVSASTTFGDSGNTLFSVGNGTADNARHNAFEIRQNGDIYISKDGQDVKLQDQLGGGGSITIDPSLDSGSTNPVANSAITNAINETARFDGYASDGYLVRISSRDDGNAISIDGMKIKTSGNYISQTAVGTWLYTSTINGKKAVSSSSSNTKDFNLVETSAITTSVTSSSTDAQVPSAKAVNDKLGGLSLVKLTQSEYDALSPNYDANTLYVING